MNISIVRAQVKTTLLGNISGRGARENKREKEIGHPVKSMPGTSRRLGTRSIKVQQHPRSMVVLLAHGRDVDKGSLRDEPGW
jgi:hypothetical protein